MYSADQEWQYQMQDYQKMLKEKGIKQSMPRKRNCLDNSPMENFFGRMKNEMFYGYEYPFIKVKIRLPKLLQISGYTLH